MAATEVSRNLQTGARGATDSFSRFVEGPDGQTRQQSSSRVEPERRDFWDSFATIGEERERQKTAGRGGGGSGAIGTGAMKRAATTTSTPLGTGSSATAPSSKGKDDWDENW